MIKIVVQPALTDEDGTAVREALDDILGELDYSGMEGDYDVAGGQIWYVLLEDAETDPPSDLNKALRAALKSFLRYQEGGNPRSQRMRSLVERVGPLSFHIIE